MVRNVTDGEDGGWVFGQNATDLISFYGATSTAQAASVAAVATTAATNANSWGYVGSAQANALTLAVATIHANLISYGLLRS